jgi:signal transduction histidine kinase
VGQLNRFVLNELIKEIPDEKTIFKEALRVTKSSIKGANILDVRMLNTETRELYFAQTYGPAWEQGDTDTVESRHKITYFVDNKPPQSTGEYVYQSGKVQSFKDPSKSPFYAGKVNFSGVKSMIVAPIKVAEETLGVLDILSTRTRFFPGNANRIAELLGQQIGLYHYLASAIKRLRQAESDLKHEIDERNQMLEDLSHQVKTPINQAFRRARRLLESEIDDKRIIQLQAVRGLCGKAKRVSMSMKLLATLARGEQIELKLENLYSDYLRRLLIEAAVDSQLMIESSRRIKVDVKRETFYLQELNRVKVDLDLLEQAIGNIVDNACKYSYEETTVQIYGGLTRNGRFHISVVNEGLPISLKDVNHCVERGWRSDTAKLVTGEGSGIGLWIVKSIMDAHGGELLIIPTTSQSKTDVKLIFPF